MTSSILVRTSLAEVPAQTAAISNRPLTSRTVFLKFFLRTFVDFSSRDFPLIISMSKTLTVAVPADCHCYIPALTTRPWTLKLLRLGWGMHDKKKGKEDQPLT